MASAGVAPALAAEPGFGIPLISGPDIDSDSSSLFTIEAEPEAPAKSTVPLAIPSHPIPAMQEAFAESLVEATQDQGNGSVFEKPKLRTADASTRRQVLLDEPKSHGPPAALWRLRPGQTNHELRKLLAQISFGVYLLLNGMANSTESAVAILQGHIDEVDEFLETTMEDIALATADVTDRIEHLKVPMSNMSFFEKMLEDRDFRLQIVEGNENIEHVLSRTATALMQSTVDIQEGLKAIREFTIYLADQQNGEWRKVRPDVIDIFEAMRGNTEGWLNAFLDLQVKGTTLDALMVKLETVVSEINRRAGEVSRRTRFSIQPFTRPTHSRTSSTTSRSSSQKTARGSVSIPRTLPSQPPRLSLGLGSDLGSGLTDSAYFEISTSKENLTATVEEEEEAEDEPIEVISTNSEPTTVLAAAVENEAKQGAEVEAKAATEPSAFEPAATPKSGVALGVEAAAAAKATPDGELQDKELLENEGKAPEAQKVVVVEPPAADDGGEIILLQPRTYTPVPPAPEPSPIVLNNSTSPTTSPVLGGPSAGNAIRRGEGSPQSTSRPFPGIGMQPPNSNQLASTPQTSNATLGASNLSEPGLPQKRTSLRQRVSLKTNPPEAIQVPPRSSQMSQRPIHSSPRSQAPDSAYASDFDRSNGRLMPEGMSPPPAFRPPILPSPQSDQQYFRPVQASPHSPLQQRPHTSGTVRPSAYQQYQAHQHHQRNVPSRMGGASMLSSVTTVTQDSVPGRSLKKKKSAFGWLKKAFSLDEEERAAFEQRKKDSAKNPYYDQRSTVFLDGKRIR